MKFSNGGIKTLREINEASKNAALLLKGGFIDQLSAGVYTYLPLGKKVLSKIENIIREEMNAAGGQEVIMPVLQPKENWQKTGRWDSLDVLYKFTSFYSKSEVALGPTHEEVVAPLAKKYINSYKDLPLYLYQIQTKFRDEKRPKSGLLRGREFLMKDLYSFHATEKDLDRYYEVMANSYHKIFERCGLGGITYYTFASGGSFSKYSHEFQTECATGEDTIYLCDKCNVAVNKEIVAEQKECPGCGNKKLKEIKAIEVGNIFKLGTKYSKPFDLNYMDENNKLQEVVMGCYGIGLGRVMGAVAEIFNDDKGLIWPASIAPFDIHLLDLGGVNKETGDIYTKLTKAGYDVLWDDREEAAGVKLGDADLLGIPLRIVVSPKTLAEGKIEVKLRAAHETNLVTLESFLKRR
jgi:prolyl-tRNA synthetase